MQKSNGSWLFKSFFRGSNTANIKGSGLGLIVAKQFTELLNGNIVINSSSENTIVEYLGVKALSKKDEVQYSFKSLFKDEEYYNKAKNILIEKCLRNSL